VSRVPVRARLTGAFALAMVIVLAGAAWFVHERVESHLDESVDSTLRARADAGPTPGRVVEDPEEEFVQLVSPGGRVLRASGGARGPALDAGDVRAALRGTLTIEREVPGIEGRARLLARRAGRNAVVAGQSLDDRDETVGAVTRAFAIGGPAAVVLASLVGYLLAGLGLAPVEAMRRRAERISLGGAEERLPLPPARDEIRRLGETLNEMLARMEASFENERRFVADASHELRTPLAVLKTELDSALRAPADEERRESLAAAVEEVDQLVQLADDLLLLAHAGEGRLTVRPEQVDLRELLERARERFADRAGERGREIVVDAPAGLTARLDPMRMRQALGNLVDNALRHGEGTVTLSASAGAITVSDAGPGFADDLAPRAFERFTRGGTARSGGSGLGLAIVRAIAEAHGGRAEVLREPPGVRLSWDSPPEARS
jgi:signal transduction histidine kinase